MVKLKEQDVVNRLKSIVGDTLDFSKGLPYKGTLFKFQAICKVCGNCFTTNVANIFSGRGCKKCADKRATLSNTEFIAKCESLYLQKFDYSLVNYEGGREPVKIICKEHSEVFEMLPVSLLSGRAGCPLCERANGDSRRLTGKKLLDQLQTLGVLSDKYVYNFAEYVTTRDKVSILCKEHGEFNISIGRLKRGSGCPKCAGNYVKTAEEVKAIVEQLAPNVYDTSKLVYKSNEDKFYITSYCCKKERYIALPSFKRRPSCPYCNKSSKAWFDKTDSGYFYILKLDTPDYFKLGITTDFNKRLNQLQHNKIKSFTYKVYKTNQPQLLIDLEKNVKRLIRETDKVSKDCFRDGYSETFVSKFLEDVICYLEASNILYEVSV